LKVPKLEKELGMEVYATKTLGIGGKIRQFVEDFTVEEILIDGSKASICPENVPLLVGEGKYLICLLVKRNWDNLLVIREIARKLGLPYKNVHIAGIKDAKAVTAQHISIEGAIPEDIAKVKIEDVILAPLRFSNLKISAFHLYGNKFTITIRDISHTITETQKRIEKTLAELEAFGGIPNFYGHQRFGTIRPITHLVGREIVKGNFEKAAMIYLAKNYDLEHEKARETRKRLMETHDFEWALRNFPRHLKYEILMLKHLVKNSNDYVGAFRKLPLQLRRMFTQAYQSYLFNRFLGERIRREIPFNEPQIGDYVVYVDQKGLPTQYAKRVESQNLEEMQKAVKEGKMRIAIPLVGYKQPTSSGIQGEIEEEILREEDVKPEDFNVKNMREASAKGELRAALTPLIDFSYEKPCKDSNNPLKKMFKCSFTLQRGSYATVFLRELMKPRNIIKAGF